MGIHPHGCLWWHKAHRKIITGDNTGKFKILSCLRRKYWSTTSLGLVRDFTILAAGFILSPFRFALSFCPSDHICYVVNLNSKIELLTQKNRPTGGFSKKGGPSDRIRTCGILLPKQARYQLRYTRINAMQILAHFFKNCNAFFPIDVSGALWYIFIL